MKYCADLERPPLVNNRNSDALSLPRHFHRVRARDVVTLVRFAATCCYLVSYLHTYHLVHEKVFRYHDKRYPIVISIATGK